MGLFGKLFGKSKPAGKPALPTAPQPTGLAGAVSAKVATDAAHGIVARLVPDAQLTSISSDSNIDHHGLARGWELVFISATRGSEIRAELAPAMETEDIDRAQLLLKLSEESFYAPLPDPAFAASVAKSLGRTVEQLEAERLREALARRQFSALPEPFRDSPEAVAALAAQGLDFVAGPTDLTLGTRRLADGQVVWVASDRSKEYTTGFDRP